MVEVVREVEAMENVAGWNIIVLGYCEKWSEVLRALREMMEMGMRRWEWWFGGRDIVEAEAEGWSGM